MSPLERLARKRKLRFLRRAGAADVAHSGEHLLEHLESVEQLLASWGAPPALCDAALFHSVYGTEFLTDELLGTDRRDEVRRLIGERAEAVAWLWHGIKRDTLAANLDRDDAELRVGLRDGSEVPITRSQLEDLVNLWFADAVEQLPRRDAASLARQEAWLTPFFATALPAAVAAARELFGAERPRVHLYAACWNEADMLGYFFDHYDPWVDRYVIFDDGSTDGSLEILARHPRVDVRRLERTRPDSLVLSLLDLYNGAWKESRGEADWVVVVNVDEQLHHPDISGYLRACRRDGVTAIPALGYQMIDELEPAAGTPLSAQIRRGAPWVMMNKLAIFDPDAIDEVDYEPGRHVAAPAGRVQYPDRDELLCLHFKCLGEDRVRARHARQAPRLLAGDHAERYGFRYALGEEETGAWLDELRGAAVEPLAAGTDHHGGHTAPRWWRSG